MVAKIGRKEEERWGENSEVSASLPSLSTPVPPASPSLPLCTATRPRVQPSCAPDDTHLSAPNPAHPLDHSLLSSDFCGDARPWRELRLQNGLFSRHLPTVKIELMSLFFGLDQHFTCDLA